MGALQSVEGLKERKAGGIHPFSSFLPVCFGWDMGLSYPWTGITLPAILVLRPPDPTELHHPVSSQLVEGASQAPQLHESVSHNKSEGHAQYMQRPD